MLAFKQDQPEDACEHMSFLAGMMVVRSEDVLDINRNRAVECESCGQTWGPGEYTETPYAYR